MLYYTKDGKVIDINTKNYLNSGTQGKISLIEPSICLKEYTISNQTKSIFDDMGTTFNQEMFDYFKFNFNDSNLCELYDLLYDDKLTTVLGYTMKYYQETINNILTMPTSYILDNYNKIYELVLKLTDECIRIVDLNSRNIINTDNQMVVIDYDKYYLDNDTEKDLLTYLNKSALIFAFKGIFKDSLKKLGINIENNSEINSQLSSLFTINTTSLVLKYRLQSYNKPIDYFTKR